MSGKVYLIGMGPGDTELITIKAVKAIKKCDVLIYDRLVNKELLEYNQNAERIYVGKVSSNHALPQDKINELIAEKAKAGMIVGRLKGGDPFVFGRGGEEALFLKTHGIKYDIIPGITSSIAVPMYASIPVTHRGIATSFHVITGHEHSEKSNIDWEALAKVNGTLVFLMGVENLEYIISMLIKYGKSKKCPAAVIMNGTRYNQEEVYGDLSNIKVECEKSNIKSPAIIVVGETVRLHEELSWKNKGPLEELKVVITRPLDKIEDICDELKDAGAIPIKLPCIRLQRSDFYIGEEQISQFKHIVFSSTYGVKYFLEGLIKNKIDIRKVTAQLYGVGSSIKEELEAIGLFDCIVPDKYSSEGLLECLEKRVPKVEPVLIVSGNIGSEHIMEGLKAWQVQRLVVYNTLEGCSEALEDDIDVIFFTSPSCIRGFLTAHSIEVYKNKLALCIGDRTAKQAQQSGFTNIKILLDSIVEKAVDELIEWRRKNA